VNPAWQLVCMSRPKPPTYRTTNWHDYNLALARRGSLSIWFDPETQWLAGPTGKRGRQPVFTDAAIQTCLTLKALFGLPLRQTTGMVASLLELAGLGWPVPDFSTLCRRQKALTVDIPYRPSTGALHLLIDSTGVKAEGDGEWSARKHGQSKPRDWRKVHLGWRRIRKQSSGLFSQRPRGNTGNPGHRDHGQSDRRCARAARPAGPDPWRSARRHGHSRRRHRGARGRSGHPSRPAGTASPGRNRPQGRGCATRPCEVAAASAGPSGNDGPATTGEVWPRPRCGA
jgi:hypothetical protein